VKREKETSNSNLGGMPDTPALFEKQSPATYRKTHRELLAAADGDKAAERPQEENRRAVV